jgi:hypothetical protein
MTTATTARQSRTMTVTFGGLECCLAADFRVTRTDAHGAVAYETCAAHRDECTTTQAQYVEGWGNVSLTVERLRLPAPVAAVIVANWVASEQAEGTGLSAAVDAVRQRVRDHAGSEDDRATMLAALDALTA